MRCLLFYSTTGTSPVMERVSGVTRQVTALTSTPAAAAPVLPHPRRLPRSDDRRTRSDEQGQR